MNKILQNALLHFKKICKHKYYVFKYCCAAGIPLQGVLHDLSKFSPTEFIESVKYYQGTYSPVVAAKRDKGYSAAWLHHKGRNPHHFEYWIYTSDDPAFPVIMPFKYAVEMYCDYLGAAHAYQEDNFSFDGEYKWWLEKKKKCNDMHPAIKEFITQALWLSKVHNQCLKIWQLKTLYNKAIRDWKKTNG